MKYDVIIGLEIHAEVKTESKMFCSCKNDPSNSKPNKNTCPVCLGHPGTLPKTNRKAIEKIILLGLALDCKINKISKFDRKNYFYPDLPKGYQISQYDLPFAYQGALEVNKQKIEITRIHLEEDTGKLNHPKGKSYTLIDYNRSGVPLIELVTEPMISDSATAKAFCQTYQQILRYLDISDANMEKGEMRCELNLSLQKKDSWYRDTKGRIVSKNDEELNPKVEVKNINSFKSLERAVGFEIKRQMDLLDSGEKVLPETRGCNDATGETFRQRIKESSSDYRYFPEPDILPVTIEEDLINELKTKIGELPHKKKKRFIEEYSISPDIAEILIADKHIANWFEMVISELKEWTKSLGQSWGNQRSKLTKMAANWMSSELFKLMNEKKIDIKEVKITAENFAELVSLVYQEKLNSSAGQKILKIIFDNGGDPSNIMKELDLEQKDDEGNLDLENVIKKIIEENKEQFNQYKEGKESLLQFFIGKTMAETKAKYKPAKIIEIIKYEAKNK
ncbi:MAG: Asp-tRNA(Asn)/Glu-tRNA(Gln) amidotransferase subunit GatB [Patescibacteria group bacterium]